LRELPQNFCVNVRRLRSLAVIRTVFLGSTCAKISALEGELPVERHESLIAVQQPGGSLEGTWDNPHPPQTFPERAQGGRNDLLYPDEDRLALFFYQATSPAAYAWIIFSVTNSSCSFLKPWR
jgi:hypothetical protein